MKVLHLPTAVGGNSWNLAEGERALGLDVTVLASSSNFFNYKDNINLHLERYRSGVLKLAVLAKHFLKIRKNYDVYHFNFGSTLVHSLKQGTLLLDIPFYPKRAKLFVTYNGCDARQKYPTMERRKIAACHDSNCYGGACNSGVLDRRRQRSIEKIAKHVEHIWALNPDLLNFLPREKSSFLPYAVPPPVQDSIRQRPADGRFRIVHAPTNREAKGSFFVIQALERLVQKYPGSIEFKLVEGISNQDALAIYAEADLVVDQLLIGWYGAFAVECMMMGKPVVARIESEDLHFVPSEMGGEVKDAIIEAGPNDIYDALEKAFLDRNWLNKKAEAGRLYALKWHHPEAVARLTVAQYEKSRSKSQTN